jgi:hypothetical protein
MLRGHFIKYLKMICVLPLSLSCHTWPSYMDWYSKFDHRACVEQNIINALIQCVPGAYVP